MVQFMTGLLIGVVIGALIIYWAWVTDGEKF